MRRTRIRAVSDRRRDDAEAHAIVREEVFRRDGFRCQFPHRLWERRQRELGRGGSVPCWGGFDLQAHHLHKAGQCGGYLAANLLSLCGPSNVAVELEPNLARELGLVIARDVTADEAQRRRKAWGSTW